MPQLERHINISPQLHGTVDLNNPVLRCESNPILTPRMVNQIWSDPALQVMTVHNAGMIRYKGMFLMLFRSHLRCGRSVLGIARSENGIAPWYVDPYPALVSATPNDTFAPGVDKAALIENESGGLEDPRIHLIDDSYLITYSAYHASVRNRVRVSLISTTDFSRFVRHGPMLDVDMRNVVIFPRTVGGRYVALFRPNDITAGDTGGAFTQIRIGFCDDWRSGRWEVKERPIMVTGGGPSAFSDKIGPGAPPIETADGFLDIFHGVRTTMDGNTYVLGVALHDFYDPRIVAMSSIPILFPTAADCAVSAADYVHVPHVVFTCGAHRFPDGTILIYYGGNDTVMNVCATHEAILSALCRYYPQDPISGELGYKVL